MDHAFTGRLIEWRGPAPFYFVPLPESVAAEIGDVARMASYGWGCIPVRARVGRTEFTTSLFPKDGGYLLPVKAAVRRPLRLDIGDPVAVELSVNVPTRPR